MMWARWQRLLRYWLHSAERARLLREEMESHLAMMTQSFMEEGMNESDARDAARRQFGNLTLHQEKARGTWIARWLTDLIQDTAYGFRTIGKQPGFTSVAILSAALGIGACSTIFGLANFALFRPLPVEQPSRLAGISGKNLARGRVGTSLTYPDFEDLRQARSFQGMSAFFQFLPATVSGNGEPQRFWGSVVSANYFDVVRPAFVTGRGFDAAHDDTKGGPPVVVISNRLWHSRFSADPGLVGRTIEMNSRKVTVVGIAGPGFLGTEQMFYSDFWVPFSMLDTLGDAGTTSERLRQRDSQWLLAVGRLRDGISMAAAAAEIEVIGQCLRAVYPATNRDGGFHVERAGQLNPGIRKMAVVFFGLLLVVSALVLCTACANIANLLLARASARQKEIATRLAIGAGRGRVVRQLLAESVMLALLGGIAGYAIALFGAAAISRSRIPLAMPVDLAISLDYRVMLFSIGLSALTGIIFGLAPALRTTRPDLVGSLKDQPVRFGHSRRYGLRNLLVVAQVTICMVLLICSGLFLRSLQSAAHTETGFAHHNLLLLAFDPSLNRYSAAQTQRLVDAMVERTRAIPGVESVTFASSIPLAMEGTQNGFLPEDSKTPITADIYNIAPGYFETFGIPLLAGEDLRAGTGGADTVIVNQALAAKAFPNQNPIGRRIGYFGKTLRITGMVATTKSRTISEDPHSILYFPIANNLRGNDSLTGMTLVLRTRSNPAAFAPVVRQTIREIDPALAIWDVRTMEAHLSQALFAPRAAAVLFGFGGLMGLLISTIGIYGVINFAVARQTREIGVRMALGARRAQVLTMVLKQGLLLTFTGSGIGLALALALSRVAGSLLYGVSATDALTFIAVPLFLLTVALSACLIPARRAASLDPIRALRYE
jgi:predicted permease